MIKVLIVDDHPAVGEGTKAIIEQEEDIQAEVILDSENILEVINKDHYDVYLLDLYMPKLNGIELSKVILQNDPDATILIYTGFNIAEHYNLLIEAGVSGFISKTETKEQLITAIRCALIELVEGQGEDEVIAIAERAGCLVAQVRELAHEGRGAGPDRLRGIPAAWRRSSRSGDSRRIFAISLSLTSRPPILPRWRENSEPRRASASMMRSARAH